MTFEGTLCLVCLMVDPPLVLKAWQMPISGFYQVSLVFAVGASEAVGTLVLPGEGLLRELVLQTGFNFVNVFFTPRVPKRADSLRIIEQNCSQMWNGLAFFGTVVAIQYGRWNWDLDFWNLTQSAPIRLAANINSLAIDTSPRDQQKCLNARNHVLHQHCL